MVAEHDDKPGHDRPPPSQRQTIQQPREPQPPTPDELTELFPQLDILELLGQGGMGYVYKARQKGLDRLVALKLLPRHVSDDRNFAERFAREARALARLSHPSIVMVHDSGQAEGLYYFVMEYVDGLNLRDLLNRSQGRVQADQALEIVGSVCDALEYAHDEGIIHRDIKPENILLDRKGRVKIADFGLAKLLGGEGGDRRSHLTLSSPNQLLGTPHYMAPEQTERPTAVDHRADIYSIGVVFYEMLTGELPLGRFPLPSEFGVGSAVLDDIVVRALDKNPERRFQRASDVRTAVRSALSGEPAALAGNVAAAPPRPLTPLTPLPPVVDPVITQTISELGQTIDLRDTADRMRWPGIWLLVASIGALTMLNPLGIITWIGAVKMKRLESRGLAIAGAIAAICSYGWCMPVGQIAGVWALILLLKPDVATAFDLVALSREAAQVSGVEPPHAVRLRR